MRELRRENGNSADRTGEEGKAAQTDLGEQRTAKAEAKQKPREMNEHRENHGRAATAGAGNPIPQDPGKGKHGAMKG